MRHTQERGVALVITLIMLSVVTLMAVAFLAVSRSQKAAVTVVQEQNEARLMARSATERAQSEIIGRMLATTNAFAHEFRVSTNLINPFGFRSGFFHPTNVGYTYLNGGPLREEDLHINLVNLYYNPRPPVFLVTNELTRANEFRFYLDLNRNRRYEPSGLLPVVGFNGLPLRGTDNRVLTNLFVGDPEWIGVLERPDRFHSPSNRFVGRYAYVVVPEGKTLDLNYIHNRAKVDILGGNDATFTREGYLRNQGFGSWEINLAAFLADLNTNRWRLAAGSYQYNTNVTQPSVGPSFATALQVLKHRYQNQSGSLVLPTLRASVPDALRPLALLNLQSIDPFPRTVYTEFTPPLAVVPQGDERWWGADNPRAFFEAQDVLRTNETTLNFTNHLVTLMANADSYNRYTFYRFMSQMGFDSAPANRKKLNLNFNNATANPTNFVAWTPSGFFTNAAVRMLHSRFNTKEDEIQIFPTNNYTAEVHRLLQVTANIFDATTNRAQLTAYPHVPSVFRPRFIRRGDVISIVSYQEVLDETVLNDVTTWVDLRIPADRQRIGTTPTDVNVYGIPWIVGAKKGWPNFNEFSLQTLVQATRKLEVGKRDPRRAPDPANVYTNQAYLLSISNRLGVEFFNSYSADFKRPLELRVQVQSWAVISNRFGALLATNIPPQLLTTNVLITSFAGGRFYVPVFRELELLPDSAYYARPINGRYFIPTRLNPRPDATPGFPIPEWDLYITNRVRCVLIDRSVTPGRIVDFVNLDGMVAGMNIAGRLAATGRVVGDQAGGGQSLSDSAFWNTNRVGDLGSATVGITNQIHVSLNNVLSDEEWQNSSSDPRSGLEKLKAIDDFRMFLGLQPLDSEVRPPTAFERVKQVPFTPTRKFYQEMKWQANDPLVHYTVADLSDPGNLTNPENIIVLRPPQLAPTNSNLGMLNERYRPWGGTTNSQPQPRFDFNLALKDPLVRGPDDWNFPTNKLASVGLLGRVHRGTPWQTIYLKAEVAPMEMWQRVTGMIDTHPTNDWNLMDLFTVAPNDNAARGLLSVNQTNTAAWSAVLSGVPVLSNSIATGTTLSRFTRPVYQPVFIQPNSPQLHAIVRSIMEAQARQPNGVFPTMGSILSARALTVDSPYLRTNIDQRLYAITDDAYERIPQQILSLLKPDEPRITVYAFGQSLRPAPNSIVVAPGPYLGLCTNYQITGEAVLKTVIRFEDAPERPRAVIESYHSLSAE